MQPNQEIFFNVADVYASREHFESRCLQVTHTELDIDATRYAEIRAAFMMHMQEDGARFGTVSL